MMTPPAPPPLAKPPFTLKELRDVIPPHCFCRSLLKSSIYLMQNVVICGFLFYVAANYVRVLPTAVQIVLWPIYWFLQGSFLTGLWVLAHECGHNAFSDYKNVDDTVGFVLHSLLLVPYFNWRISHRKHHLNTASCEHDEPFVPPSRSTVQSAIVEMLEDSPIYNGLTLLLMLTLGWMPGYLLTNIGGPIKYGRLQAVSHFTPSSPIFSVKQKQEVIVGDVGVLMVAMALAISSTNFGLLPVLLYYGIPYLIVNCYMILATFLQHTDVYIPHFREKEWTWLRGALCTVDRSFFPLLDKVLHHLCDAHVCHHIFPQIPYYNAVEATKAMSKTLGRYYLKDNTPILTALWRAHKSCKFVEDEDTVAFYKSNLKQGITA